MSMSLLSDKVLIVRRSSRMVNSQPQSQRSSDVPVMHECIVLIRVRVKINQSLHLINGPINGAKISGQSNETSRLCMYSWRKRWLEVRSAEHRRSTRLQSLTSALRHRIRTRNSVVNQHGIKRISVVPVIFWRGNGDESVIFRADTHAQICIEKPFTCPSHLQDD
jgi:hypothetical protein